jgi:serine/threonine protein kinase
LGLAGAWPTLARGIRKDISLIAGRYELGREVALKRIGMIPGASGPDLERAEREARLAARLNHPHVVAVFDLVSDGNETWLVMEYV